MVQPYALPDAPGGDACIIGVKDGAPQLGQAEVENVHLWIKIPLAPGEGESQVSGGPERLRSHDIGDGGAKLVRRKRVDRCCEERSVDSQ